MPTYGYRCTACEHRFDQFQRMTDDPLTDCPACGGLVRRVIHPVGVVFKGSGWYITDSRKSSSAENGSADGAKKDAEPKGAAEAKKDGDAAKPAETAKSAKTEPAKSAAPAAD